MWVWVLFLIDFRGCFTNDTRDVTASISYKAALLGWFLLRCGHRRPLEMIGDPHSGSCGPREWTLL